MKCSCGYDNTPYGDTRLPERCEGCGVPLRPADDDHPPEGGRIKPDEGDEPVEIKMPNGETRLLIEQDYSWGRGIGAEPSGYYTTKAVEIVDKDCPECGYDRARREWNSDGVVAGETFTCQCCMRTIEQHLYD